MKIVILSRTSRIYSTSRLIQACKQRGHTVKVLDTMKFSIDVEPGHPELFYAGKHIGHVDAVIPRIGASITFFGTAVVRQFEQMGVFCLNPSHAISVSRDKLRSAQVLSRHRIGLPKTSFVKLKSDVLPAISRVGGAPVIVKLLEGTQGVGVILAENNKIAEAIIETLQTTKQNVLIQNFVAESRGKDIRAFVVGGKVVAAMRRSAQGEEFRSNVHRGGVTAAIELNEIYKATAVQAAQILGLQVAGVDMLESDNGPQVMEVNSSPGLEGIEAATGVDIAQAIVKHIEEQVQFPDVDIRQRLTLKQGYGVAEIPVPEESELAGKMLRKSGLAERDVIVLSVLRGSISFPNPAKNTVILPGDVLVCFGKQITMKSLIPPQVPNSRKKHKKAVKKKTAKVKAADAKNTKSKKK